MSIILKALQRAERERKDSLDRAGAASVFWSTASHKRRKRQGSAIFVALVVGVGAGGWFLQDSAEMDWSRPGREARQAERNPPIASSMEGSVSPRPVLSKEIPQPSEALPIPAAVPVAKPPDAQPAPGKRHMASFKMPEGKVQTTEAPLQQASAGMDETDLARQRTMPRGENAAESEMEKGLIAERKGRLSEAIGHFLALARKRPGSAAVHTALGRLYSKRGNYILAINEFRLAAEYAPGDSEPLYALSVLYARLGSGSSALQYLKKVIEKDARVRERAFHEPAFSAFRRDPGFQMLFSSFTEKSKP